MVVGSWWLVVGGLVLDELRQLVCWANLELDRRGLVVDTWGNVSGIDRAAGAVVIKPSGVPYDGMRPEQMVVVSLADGRVIEGQLKPSSDAPTHLEIYRAFDSVGGVAHAHSLHATAWAQAGRDVPCLGTTHADYVNGPIPCTRPMTPEEIRDDYEANTGRVIVERMAGMDPLHVPVALVAGHGPFVWGKSADEAVQLAAIVEHLARLASATINIDPSAAPVRRELLAKHFGRKHGPGAYYGQRGGGNSKSETRNPKQIRNSNIEP